MQRARRQETYPLTWEIPVAVLTVIALVVVYGVHLGRGVANLIAGAGWAWPASEWVFRSLPAVLAGNATAGLPRGALSGDPAGSALTLGTIAVTEVILLGLGIWAAVVAWRRWGPSRIRGMATRGEAETLLGRSRLRTAAHVVRPDLHHHSDRRGAHDGSRR